MKALTVGSTFEISLRILLMFNEIKEVDLDEQQIASIDFISVYAADFGILDENLHGYGSYRFSEYPARKSLVTAAIKDLVLDGYVRFIPSKDGFKYAITSDGRRICGDLTDDYAKEYAIAVRAVMRNFDITDGEKLSAVINQRTMQSLKEEEHE